MKNIQSKEKIPLNKITKEKIDYGKQFKIEEDINGIFNKLNSNSHSNKKEENLNFERENLNNIKEENEINEKEGNSIYSDYLKNNSFNSKEFESHKSTIIENSLNLDNIINIEISNNLNENLTKNENRNYNSNNNSFDNKLNKEVFHKKQKNNKINKEKNNIDTSVNRNDGTTLNILTLNNNNEKGKNLSIIKKYSEHNKIKEINQQDNETQIKNYSSKKCSLFKKICIFFLCIIIILIIIIQILIFLKYL